MQSQTETVGVICLIDYYSSYYSLLCIAETKIVLGDSVIVVTPVGDFPQALEYNPSNNNTYVASTLTGADGLISVIQ